MCVTLKWKIENDHIRNKIENKFTWDKNKFQNIPFSNIFNDSSYIKIFLDQEFKLKNKKSDKLLKRNKCLKLESTIFTF